MADFESEDIAIALCLPAGSAVQGAQGKHAEIAADELAILLFDQLSGRLLLYVRAFGLPTQDSEDVLQETFLSLFQHLLHNRSRANLRSWLFRVAHNLALKRRSSLKGLNSAESALAEHRDFAPTPHDLFEFKETHSRCRAVFEALPEQDRCCVLLRAEGMKYREISALVGMSLGSVSTSLTRSLQRLARAAER